MDTLTRDRTLRLAGVEVRRWQDQDRDPGGEDGGRWVPMGGLAKDALKLAGRMDLEPGEELVGSGAVGSDDVSLPVALTSGPKGRRLRIGAVDPADEGSWRGRNLGGTAILDEAATGRLRAGVAEMLARAPEAKARADKADAAYEALLQRRRDVIRQQYSGLTKRQAKDLDQVDERLEAIDGRLKRIAQDMADRERRMGEPGADVAFLRSRQSVRGRERDGLLAERRGLAASRAELTSVGGRPQTSAELAEIGGLDVLIAAADREHFDAIADQTLVEGLVGGDWGDVSWRLETDEHGQPEYVVEPPGDGDPARLGRDQVEKLARLLSPAGDAARSTLDGPGRHRVLQLLGVEVRAWSPEQKAKHPHYPKGHPKAGKFRPTADQLMEALAAWSKGGGGGHPFEGFKDREPLRREAVKRGIKLRRGASIEEIKDALLDDLKVKPDRDADAKKPTEGELKSAAVRVRDAYRELTSRPGELASLARLREKLSDVPRADLDRVLRDMDRRREIQLDPDPNRKALPAEAHAAAVRIGGEDKHLISIASPEGGEPDAKAPTRAGGVEGQIETAYAAISKRNRLEWVDLADLRREMGEDADHAAVDAALDKMIERPDVRLMAELNQMSLTPARRAAAVRIGGEDRHLLKIKASPPDAKAPALLVARPGEAGLTAAQKSAVRRYTNSDVVTAQVNGILREGKPHTALIHRLDEAMAASRTTEPMLTYRGLAELAGLGREGGTLKALGLSGPSLPEESLVGHEWTEESFASTSTRKGIAETFSSGDNAVLLEIRVPAGTHAIDRPGGEEELLLDRGLTYRVTGDRIQTTMVGIGGDEPSHKRVLEVEVVPAKRAPAKKAAGIEMDSARAAAEMAIEVEELVAKGASGKALVHRVRARMKRMRLEPVGDGRYVWKRPGGDVPIDPDAASGPDPELNAAQGLVGLAAEVERLAVGGESGDAVTDRVRKALRGMGLEPDGRAGERVAFDRARHDPLGPAPASGASVVVVRPGYTWKSPDGDALVERPLVQDQGPPPARKAAPRKAPATPSKAPLPTTAEFAANEQRIRDTLDAVPAGLHRQPTGLTPKQRAALREYQGLSFVGINNQIRQGRLNARNARVVEAIDSAMEASRLARDVEVWRGVQDGRLALGSLEGDLTGRQWEEQAYLSTSADEHAAKGFADQAHPAPVMMRIKAPEGSGAVGVSGRGDQSELLLERGLAMRVTADHGVVDGVRRLDVEVARPKAAAEPDVDSAAARQDLSDRLVSIGRREPQGREPLDRAARRLAGGDAPADVAKGLRSDAKAAGSKEDAETLRLLAADLTRKDAALPYVDAQGNVDLPALAEDAGVDLSGVYAPAGATTAATAPVAEQRPFSYSLEVIVKDLKSGKIGRTPAARRLREEADRAERIGALRAADPRADSNYDIATAQQGPLAAAAFRRLADALDKAKVPAKKRAATLSGTTLGEVVAVDEGRFASATIKGGLLRHRGEAVPDSFRHGGNGTALATAAERQHRPGLTGAESRALDLYTVGAVADGLNGSLRRGRNAHGDVDVGAVGRVDLDGVRRDLDTAIEASELSDDAILWRGAVVSQADLRRLVPGALYSDAGYMSTAATENGARQTIEWRKRQGLPSGRKAVLFKILAPSGTHAALGHERVDELVLGRGQELRVVRLDDDGPVPVVVLEAIQRAPDARAARGRHLVDEFDYDAATARAPRANARAGEGDRWLAAIQEEQGFNGLPQVASGEEVDAAVAAGATEVFRGLQSADFAEQFRSGSLYPGDPGLFGSGTYASPNRDVALGFASGDNAAVLRIALRRDAKVISYADLLKLRAKHGGTRASQALSERQAAELAQVDPGDSASVAAILARYDELRVRQSSRSRVNADEGRIAALLGYDAISVPTGRRVSATGPAILEAEYVILNRTALIVEEGR